MTMYKIVCLCFLIFLGCSGLKLLADKNLVAAASSTYSKTVNSLNITNSAMANTNPGDADVMNANVTNDTQ
jgi:hypothetical protein